MPEVASRSEDCGLLLGKGVETTASIWGAWDGGGVTSALASISPVVWWGQALLPQCLPGSSVAKGLGTWRSNPSTC